MKNYKLLLLFLGLTAGFSACNNDDGGSDVEPSSAKVNLLTTPTIWVFSGYTVNPGLRLQDGSVATDLYPLIRSTSQDDAIKFYQDPNTYTQEEGQTKDQGRPQIQDAGDWYLSSDESALIFASGSGNQLSVTIDELTETILRYSYTQADSTTVYTFTETYTAQ